MKRKGKARMRREIKLRKGENVWIFQSLLKVKESFGKSVSRAAAGSVRSLGRPWGAPRPRHTYGPTGRREKQPLKLIHGKTEEENEKKK